MTSVIEIHCLPSLAYCHVLLHSDLVLLECCENYNKRSFRNRIHLLSSQGITLFSIPLKKGKNEQTPIREVQIAYDTNWAMQLTKTLKSLYQSAPYFEHYMDSLLPIIHSEPNTLFVFNMKLFRWVMASLGVAPGMACTTTYETNYPHPIVDLRETIKPGNKWVHESYPQIFGDLEDCNNLSVLDLIFNLGPESRIFLNRMSLASQLEWK